MGLISSLPNHVIREMTPKGNVIRECMEIEPVIRDPDTASQTLLDCFALHRMAMDGI